MPKVMTIEFEVDMGKGELPYRSYVSSEPVQDNMFVLISKILENDNVFFKLYSCTPDGNAQLRLERETSQEKFKDSVILLETDLQKANPNVTMVRQDGGKGFAVSNNGPVDLDTAKGLAGLASVQGLMEKVLTQLENGTVDKVELLIDAIETRQFSPEEMTMLFATLEPEEKARAIMMLKDRNPAKANHPLFAPLEAYANHHSKEGKPATKPASRISKFL